MKTIKHLASAVTVALIALIIFGCIFADQSELRRLQSEKLASLDNKAGAFDEQTIVLNDTTEEQALELGKKLYANHTDKYSSFYNTPVGVVVANKVNPALWGIKMSLEETVEIRDANGNTKEIAPGGVIPIVRNLKIKFNENMIGEIK